MTKKEFKKLGFLENKSLLFIIFQKSGDSSTSTIVGAYNRFLLIQ